MEAEDVLTTTKGQGGRAEHQRESIAGEPLQPSPAGAAPTTGCSSPEVSVAVRTFLDGLSGLEVSKIRDFLAEAPVHLQDALCKVLSRYETVEDRSSFLRLLEELDDVSPLLLKAVNLPSVALPEVLRLFQELGPSRFSELVAQEGQRTEDFVSLLFRMPSDIRTLILRECQPLPFSIVTHVMDDVLTAPVMEKCKLCAMKRAKKFDTDQAFNYKTKYRRGSRHNIVETTSDIWSEPAWQRLLSFRPSKPGDSQSCYDVYFDDQEVDIFKTCLSCLRQVQRFVSEHGNAFEVYHTIGAEQKQLLTDNVRRAQHKARWWTQKGHKMLRVIGVIELFIRCRRILKEMKQEDERLRRLVLREQAADSKKGAKKAIHDELVHRAHVLDVKWLDQERRAVEHLFRIKRLYCMLQEEQELGVVRDAPSTRENPLSTKLSGFLPPDGIPITAERASEVFGTKTPDIKDYVPDLRRWKEEACNYEKQSNAYRDFRDEMLKASSHKDFELRLERWRAGVKLVEERAASRVMAERQEQHKRQLIRQDKRAKAKAAREEMEGEAKRRAALAMAAQEAAKKEKKREEEVEANESRRMMEEELRQTRRDRFWGIENWERDRKKREKEWARQRQHDLKVKRRAMASLNLIKIEA